MGIGYIEMCGNVLGNLIVRVLYVQAFGQVEYMNFHYPAELFAIFYAVILSVCAAVPLITYRSINRATVSERLRQAE